MKRDELVRYLVRSGCIFEREGKKHTLFYNPETQKSATIPRHKEIGIAKLVDIESSFCKIIN